MPVRLLTCLLVVELLACPLVCRAGALFSGDAGSHCRCVQCDTPHGAPADDGEAPPAPGRDCLCQGALVATLAETPVLERAIDSLDAWRNASYQAPVLGDVAGRESGRVAALVPDGRNVGRLLRAHQCALLL